MRDQCMEYAQAAAEAAENKKANDVVVLDIRGISVIADYFVICSAMSRIQVQSIADAVRDRLEILGVRCRGMEGKEEGKWILVDFGDVVVHVFNEDERKFYGLERLWADAPRLTLPVGGGMA
ncbi:ribosome silencing factor [Ferroacidibacillus organovorans]|uniref:Ribosomal silencing factor RsfS n=1 Tax=Ferroacidibacillus organovorans TaxID=1765683 RepID=A0A124IWG8_9BACL|nr:ribosome silencing factor [Ferroacidibacillus organovorans]KUO97370.1 hypothetical protein ATW55_05735 [Ferroacidibacillus organovorans]